MMRSYVWYCCRFLLQVEWLGLAHRNALNPIATALLSVARPIAIRNHPSYRPRRTTTADEPGYPGNHENWLLVLLFRHMFPAENFGRHISKTTESSVEITMTFNAYLKGYLAYGQITFNQEVLCLVNANP